MLNHSAKASTPIRHSNRIAIAPRKEVQRRRIPVQDRRFLVAEKYDRHISSDSVCQIEEEASMLNHSRVSSLVLLFVIVAALLAACGGTAPAPAGPAATAAEPSAGGILNGVTLPDDAAPPDQQVLIEHYDNTADFTTIDFWESVYKRGGSIADLLTEPLVRINKNV